MRGFASEFLLATNSRFSAGDFYAAACASNPRETHRRQSPVRSVNCLTKGRKVKARGIRTGKNSRVATAIAAMPRNVGCAAGTVMICVGNRHLFLGNRQVGEDLEVGLAGQERLPLVL
jgi:hypothetical protein